MCLVWNSYSIDKYIDINQQLTYNDPNTKPLYTMSIIENKSKHIIKRKVIWTEKVTLPKSKSFLHTCFSKSAQNTLPIKLNKCLINYKETVQVNLFTFQIIPHVFFLLFWSFLCLTCFKPLFVLPNLTENVLNFSLSLFLISQTDPIKLTRSIWPIMWCIQPDVVEQEETCNMLYREVPKSWSTKHCQHTMRGEHLFLYVSCKLLPNATYLNRSVCKLASTTGLVCLQSRPLCCQKQRPLGQDLV